MKPWLKFTSGIVLAISVIAFIVIWDTFLKDEIAAIEVVVVRPDKTILANQEITSDQLIVEKRKRANMIEGAVSPSEINEIVGKDAAMLMLGNSIVSKEYIDFDNLVPDSEKGEAIRPIPNDWIYAKPGSLRRKDRIDIYLWEPEPKETMEGFRSPEEMLRQENVKTETNILQGKQPLLIDVPVIYAKDSSNQEVINQTNNKDESRLNASGEISFLEVNLNEDDFGILSSAVKSGYKLYITYN